MTYPATTLTEAQIFSALRQWLIATLPPNVPVIRGQPNRVAEPQAPLFVVITQLYSERLETNTDTYSDQYPSGSSTISQSAPFKVTFQVDFHGAQQDGDTLYGAADCMHTCATLWRSEYGITLMNTANSAVTPLYVDIRGQTPWTNGEAQIEERWTMDAAVQANMSVTIPQQFAGALHANIIDVTAVYPH